MNASVSPRLLAPAPLIVNGRACFGQFSDSLRQINHHDFRLETPFGKPAGRLPSWLGFKQFQFFAGMSEQLLFGCALAHLRHSAMAFIYTVDMKTGEMVTRTFRSPLGLGMTLANNPVDGSSRFRLPGVDIRMGYRDQPREKSLYVKVGDWLEIDAVMPETGFEPMSVCTRTAYTGWVYTNKMAGLPLQGHIIRHGTPADLAQLGAMGSHDFSCGHMRRETYWNWACLSGTGLAADGTRHAIGLNLTCGVNETSFSDNCLWLDGRRIKTTLARFDFDAHNILAPWRVCSDDGRVDLCFTAVGMHRETMDVKLLASNFRQIFGRFDGVLRTDKGDIRVAGVPGFVEDQYAKW
ncbi:MAG: DUF2804 domain-containing protein [Moraxellaceae bacterium]|nr:DUF2804 domain-containing protein [Moraxellaceae bacterium]